MQPPQLKVAITFAVPDGTVSKHVLLVELMHPVQPPNVLLLSGVAVSVTVLPTVNCAPQIVPGQLIPAGMLVTMPLPDPAGVTITTACVVEPPGQSGSAGLFTVTVA